ncbi:MAG TPA: hypothetical protein VE685_02935 [Thermoanaerobaculia bacterium]|nr:hypothetical protein [Thermoanaerobaculia bacterium]
MLLHRASPVLSSLALAILLAGCGAEVPPRLTDEAGPRLEAPPPQPRREKELRGTVLKAVGRQSFQGTPAYRCVLHEDSGLQINFRTGDPEVPAVVVRIEDYSGGGPYRATMFVTGRSRAGALVTSTGEANLEVRQQDLPDASEVVLLSGSFQGIYDGPAGRGSVQGRFGTCSYSLPEEVQSLAASAVELEPAGTGDASLFTKP